MPVFGKKILFAVFLAVMSAWPLCGQTGTSVSGFVKDKKTGEPVVGASVGIDELSAGAVTGRDGSYSIRGVPEGKYSMVVRYLGYAPVRAAVEVRGSVRADFTIEQQSLYLGEVTIMAERSLQGGSSAEKVTQAALEYIQPSSLADIFQLLPGYLSSDSNISGKQQAASRQAGSDENTALGTAVTLNGAPISNNASMLRLPDEKVSSRSTVGGGVDLRQISTDHIEQVEVVRGIPSVKYGDLSSGAVIMKPKSGVSPVNIRVKADPLNKLFYIGKGFKIGEKGGTLHLGADLTQGKPDVRDNLSEYTRISFQANYAKKSTLAGRTLSSNATFYYIGTIDSEKSDPDISGGNDSYRSRFDRFMLSYNGRWDINTKAVNHVELTLSADYTSNILSRRMTVSPKGAIPYPTATQQGEHEGTYLPSIYVSDYKNEDKPLSVFAQAEAVNMLRIKNAASRLTVGIEASLDKNLGRGMVYDAAYPPYPTSTYASRPRPYDDVPAMVRSAFYAEERLMAPFGGHKLSLTAGVRLSMLHNLPDGYEIKGRVYAEPRVNVSWAFPAADVSGVPVTISVRAGYGRAAKMPTLDYLYPEKAYNDVVALNYYSQTEENRTLWTYTSIKDRANKALEPNINTKYEAGADFSAGKYNLSFTVFHEESTSGFAYDTRYYSLPYTKYSELKGPVSGKPVPGDFIPEKDTALVSYQTAVNSARTVKKGVEYSISIPEIRAIRTSVTVNGAYYRTLYDNSLPMQRYPGGRYMGKPYPYVGIYDWDYSTYREQFNTNFWLNTHIPKFRLYFSAVVQVVWISRSWSKRFSGLPTSYISLDGEERPFTAEMADDPKFSALIMNFSDGYFTPNKSPVSVSLNLKASKEIGKNLRASFFVNRLWDYNPRYRTNLNTETRRWVIPFFGAEMQIKI